MHYIWHVFYCVWYHIHYMCDITQCLYLWHHTLCLWHIHIIWHHTQCYDNTTIVLFHSHSVWHHTHCICVITPMDQFYHAQCMYDITATMCMTSYALHVISHPQFRTSHHFMYDIRSNLSDLTSTVSLSSHPPYWWYHSHYMYDLTSSISVTSHPLYLWPNIR